MDFDCYFSEEFCKTCNLNREKYSVYERKTKLECNSLPNKTKLEIEGDNQRKMEDAYCNCCSKNGRGPGGERKSKSERGHEKVLENSRHTWNRTDIEWQNKTIHRSFTPEGVTRVSAESKFSDNFSDLEEKVNFLFEIFKSYGSKITTEGNDICLDGGDQIKVPGITLGEIWQLFNLNKRMCAVEEAVEKLRNNIQHVDEKLSQKEISLLTEDPHKSSSLSESSNLNAAHTMTLKSRNDLLMNLMKNFLKIGTIDDIYSKLALLPETEVSKSQPIITQTTHKSYSDNRISAASIEDENEIIIESLTRLKEQLEDIEEVKEQSECINMEVEEKEAKYTGSKLEVISEQAEIALQEKPETAIKMPKEMTLDNFNGEFFRGDGVEFSATTSRLLAQEALLKSSLDKVHYELLSNLDSSEKNYLKSNPFVTSEVEMSSTIIKKTSENDENTESFSDGGSTSTCEPETTTKETPKESHQTSIKCTKLSDFKDAFKNSLLRNTLNKNCLNSIREENAKQTKFPRKIYTKGSCTLLKAPEKSFRPTHFSPDLSAGRRKVEATPADNLRPLTAPNSARKSIVPPTDLRKLSSRNIVKPTLLLDKTGKKEILGDVKNSNKNLLSKKLFVQAS